MQYELPGSNETAPGEQPLTALASICVTDLGIVSDAKSVQYWKQFALILVSSEPASNDIDTMCEETKQDSGSTSTLRGIQMDCTEQKRKHFSFILLNREPSSNVNLPKWADSKHDLEKTSTDWGIRIDGKTKWEKQRSPMRRNRESTSNVKVLKTKLSSKHDFPRTSTERGMQSDCNEQWLKHSSPKRSTLELLSKITRPCETKRKQPSPRVFIHRQM
jgi:hypothetical protein